MGRLNRWRAGAVILVAAVFVLGIPSLPMRQHHLAFWVGAVLLEAALLYALWPLERH